MKMTDTYNGAISRIHSEEHDEEAVRLRELAALVELGLGHRLEEQTFRALADIQADFRSQQRNLSAQLAENTLSPEDYLAQLNAAMASWMHRSEALVGSARFDAIFGESGRHPDGMIDRKVFLEQFSAL